MQAVLLYKVQEMLHIITIYIYMFGTVSGTRMRASKHQKHATSKNTKTGRSKDARIERWTDRSMRWLETRPYQHPTRRSRERCLIFSCRLAGDILWPSCCNSLGGATERFSLPQYITGQHSLLNRFMTVLSRSTPAEHESIESWNPLYTKHHKALTLP